MKDIERLLEAYVAFPSQPVRSPFSHVPGTPGHVQNTGVWLDMTDLYNVTHPEEAPFRKVLYSETMNTLLQVLEEEYEDSVGRGHPAIVTLGIKAAKGAKKDALYVDRSIKGAGRLGVSMEQADLLHDNPSEFFLQYRPEYARRLGLLPLESLTEKAQSKSQQRLFGMAYAVDQGEKDLEDMPEDLQDKIQDLIDSMDSESIKDYAETSTKDLPDTVEDAEEKKDEAIEEAIREGEAQLSDFSPSVQARIRHRRIEKKLDTLIESEISKFEASELLNAFKLKKHA